MAPDVVRALMGWSYPQMMAALEAGRLGPVWDIRLPGAHRAAWRFWLPALVGLAPQHQDPIPAVLGTQLRAWYWGGQVARLLACSVQHVTALLDAGELALAGHGISGRRITADSLRSFLARRLQG